MSEYTITQVASQLGIKVHTIRYWEKNVPLLSVHRDEYGKRLYNRQAIYLLIRLRYFIDEKKYTLKGAADMLIKEVSEETHKDQRKDMLEIMKQLELQRERLTQAQELLHASSMASKEEDEDNVL